MDEPPPLLDVDDVSVAYGPAIAVDRVSFSVAPGTTFALVGESGCGKTTLARVAVGLIRPNRGDVRFEGTSIVRRAPSPAVRRRINMIFQNPGGSLDPRWRVRDIVAEPLRALGLSRSRSGMRAAVADLLRQVGLTPEDGGRYPHEFSGGQKQRISIARALSSNPSFLACDEPTSALDVSVQAQILNLMRDLQAAHGLAYLFISHDLAVVRHMSDRLAVMLCGRIVETGPSEAIFRDPRHPYTRLLLANAGADHGVLPEGGGLGPPALAGIGCVFAERCPLADARCRRERPALIEANAVAVACHAVAEGRDGP